MIKRIFQFFTRARSHPDQMWKRWGYKTYQEYQAALKASKPQALADGIAFWATQEVYGGH
jgi:hypothetical protein